MQDNYINNPRFRTRYGERIISRKNTTRPQTGRDQTLSILAIELSSHSPKKGSKEYPWEAFKNPNLLTEEEKSIGQGSGLPTYYGLTDQHGT